MRKSFAVTAILIVTLFLSMFAVAQDNKLDVFVGGQYRHVSADASANAPGWDLSATYKFNPTFGITGDIDGYYAGFQFANYRNFNPVNVSNYDYMVGPQLTILKINDKGIGYVHALFGVSHAAGDSISTNAFTYALGGGLNIPVSKRLTIRPVQVDYLPSHYTNGQVNTFKYSGGLVFNLF